MKYRTFTLRQGRMLGAQELHHGHATARGDAQ